MKNLLILFAIFFLFQACSSQNQKKDTIYILFDERNEGMVKNIIPREKLTRKGGVPVDDSFVYKIDERKEGLLYEFAYEFLHFNRSENAYIRDSLTYKPPQIIRKNKEFLDSINTLTNDFFKNTKYRDVCKTFEEEDSWDQDVVIYILT